MNVHELREAGTHAARAISTAFDEIRAAQKLTQAPPPGMFRAAALRESAKHHAKAVEMLGQACQQLYKLIGETP